MSISNLYMLGPVVVAAGQINQIKSYNFDLQAEVISETSDGQVDVSFAAVMMQSPQLNFSTSAIARALGIAGISGYAIAAAADLWFQKIAAGGTRSGGATSVKVSGSKGLLCPRSISCSDRQPARMDMGLILVSSNGTTAPVAQTTGQTMPAITAADQLFVNGPISMNGTVIEGVKDTQIDFGLDLIIEHGSGEGYPTFVGIKRRQPKITFKTTDVTIAGAGGFIEAQGATDSLVYLRAMKKNGLRELDAATAHIKFSIDDGIFTVRSIGEDEDGAQMSEVELTPTWDGTNDVIAITTGVAIA